MMGFFFFFNANEMVLRETPLKYYAKIVTNHLLTCRPMQKMHYGERDFNVKNKVYEYC